MSARGSGARTLGRRSSKGKGGGHHRRNISLDWDAFVPESPRMDVRELKKKRSQPAVFRTSADVLLGRTSPRDREDVVYGRSDRRQDLCVSPILVDRRSQATLSKQMLSPGRFRDIEDFEAHAVLGAGGYGQVFLMEETATGLVLAVKRMSRTSIQRTNQKKQVDMEIRVLKNARVQQVRWIVQLHYSFSDDDFLYMGMQFCPGGDLRGLLDNTELEEENVKFFAAEICIGHLKLADFGLSVPLTKEADESDSSSEEVEFDHNGKVIDDVLSRVNIMFIPPADLASPRDKTEPELTAKGVLSSSILPSSDSVWKTITVVVGKNTTAQEVINAIKSKVDFPAQTEFFLQEHAVVNEALVRRVIGNSEPLFSLVSPAMSDNHCFKMIQKQMSKVTTRLRSNTTTRWSVPTLETPETTTKMFYDVVGSPNYMAQEVIKASTGYLGAIDWWSVGIIIFEMLTGTLPFVGATAEEVFQQIVAYEGDLEFKEEWGVSRHGRDLIGEFLLPADLRLGARGLPQISRHPFFAGIHWKDLQHTELDSKFDVGYFPDAETDPELVTQANLTSSTSRSLSRSNKDLTSSHSSQEHSSEGADPNWNWSWFH